MTTPTLRYRVFFRARNPFGVRSVDISVPEDARRFWEGDTDFEIAAEMACIVEGITQQDIVDVKEI